MLEEIGGWPEPLQAAQQKLEEAEKTLNETRATIEDLSVEAENEPALESQLRAITSRLAGLRERHSKANSDVIRIKRLYDCLCKSAPPILREVVERRATDLGVDASRRAAEHLAREIADEKRMSDQSNSQSLWSWLSPHTRYRIVWQAVKNLCPEALEVSSEGKKSLNRKRWSEFLESMREAIPAKEKKLAELHQEIEQLVEESREPIHAWINARQLEVSMLLPSD
ncbi:hypothetical protein [Aeoliella mucimassa]|nr:hypothetical protein [Aeoliella mucimassa]